MSGLHGGGQTKRQKNKTYLLPIIGQGENPK